MKFLAMLKDSLREAIDTKVFYVMVGLSVLVTLLTFTLSFKPRSGEPLFENPMFAMPLTADNPDDVRLDTRFLTLMETPGFHAYKVFGAEPANGAPEGPSSPYQLTMRALAQSPKDAAKLRDDPSPAVARIKERFGTIDDMRILTVTDVRLAPSNAPFIPKEATTSEVFFLVDVTPTAEARRLWPHAPSLFFGAVPLSFLGEPPLGVQLFVLEDRIINGIGAWVAILISIIITAFFIPNMVRKGTVDLLLVKPIHRTTLLLYKYVGGLIFIFLNTTIVVLGIWLALGLRSGIWAPSFLLVIFVITAFFAILYSVSTLFAVLTRSPIVAILLTVGVWFILFAVGIAYQMGEGLRQEEKRRAAAATAHKEAKEKEPKKEKEKEKENEHPKGRHRNDDDEDELPFRSDNWFFNTVRAVHFVLPRAKDLDLLMSSILWRDLLTANQIKQRQSDDMNVSWGESLTVSGLFMAVMLGLSCLRFATKDY